MFTKNIKRLQPALGQYWMTSHNMFFFFSFAFNSSDPNGRMSYCQQFVFVICLYDHIRPHVLSWISDKKKQITQFLMREHIPMNITAKLGSNWPSGFGFNGFYNLKDIRGQHGANKAKI
jgi:hypothetical protein